MREINHRPVIDYITERILTVTDREQFCIATSTDLSDDIIYKYCQENDLKCYRGSLTNVAGRFLEAAVENQWDYAVRINGDNFFVETNVLRLFLEKAQTGEYDFLSNTHNKTFPQGMSVEAVRTEFYQKAYLQFSEPEDFEHVTFFLHVNNIGKYFFYDNTTCPEATGLKFAIDEEKDFLLCKKLLSKMGDNYLGYNMKEILNLYKQIDHE